MELLNKYFEVTKPKFDMEAVLAQVREQMDNTIKLDLFRAFTGALGHSQEPEPDSERVFRNGMLLNPGQDYVIQDGMIRFTNPTSGRDAISVTYQTGNQQPLDLEGEPGVINFNNGSQIRMMGRSIVQQIQPLGRSMLSAPYEMGTPDPRSYYSRGRR